MEKPESLTKTTTLYEVQPASCRAPLPYKELDFNDWFKEKHPHKMEAIKRVMFFDPTELYARIAHLIDPYARHQGLQMDQVFPRTDNGDCVCGCGLKGKEYSTGKYQKYHSDVCRSFTSDVLSILNNYFKVPSKYITRYAGDKCVGCGGSNWLELDHIVGVKHGGGGSWLSNYEWKCKDCHREKTNKDFGFKSNKENPDNQLKIID